ncbi:hypothetical protein BDC45DRAFT_580924 [Circinella umbellata]|nr:hypothetical protein BDC45DRAFT_580924 [Circinella umbellata]
MSFTTPGQFYEVYVNEITDTMIGCTCPDHVRSGALCKHMFLVKRIEKIALMDRTSRQVNPLLIAQATEHQVDDLEDALVLAMERLSTSAEKLNTQLTKVSRTNYDPTATRYINKVAEQLSSAWSTLKRHESSNTNPNNQNRYY